MKEEQYIDKMKSVLDIVQKLTDPSQVLSLGQVAHMFIHLQVIYSLTIRMQLSIDIFISGKPLRGIL